MVVKGGHLLPVFGPIFTYKRILQLKIGLGSSRQWWSPIETVAETSGSTEVTVMVLWERHSQRVSFNSLGHAGRSPAAPCMPASPLSSFRDYTIIHPPGEAGEDTRGPPKHCADAVFPSVPPLGQRELGIGGAVHVSVYTRGQSKDVCGLLFYMAANCYFSFLVLKAVVDFWRWWWRSSLWTMEDVWASFCHWEIDGVLSQRKEKYRF